MFHRLGAMKDARQSVVVPRRDGIEFVVMTTGTAQRQSKKDFAKCVQLLINDISDQLFFVLLRQHLWTEYKKASRRQFLRR